MLDFNSLLPAPSCVICDKTLDQIGGRRITAQKARGIAAYDTAWTLHDRQNLQYSERLVEDSEIFLNVWGVDDTWTRDVIDKIRSTYLSGFRPWFCQGMGCGYRQCRKCGKAQNLPCASDILYEDGSNPHLMVIPADMGCVNLDCENFRELDVGWQITQVGYQAA